MTDLLVRRGQEQASSGAVTCLLVKDITAVSRSVLCSLLPMCCFSIVSKNSDIDPIMLDFVFGGCKFLLHHVKHSEDFGSLTQNVILVDLLAVCRISVCKKRNLKPGAGGSRL
jgi:hypothetical protein